MTTDNSQIAVDGMELR